MEGYINNYNFKEMEAMRYYSPPASWDAEKKRTLARDRIFSGDWIAARKMDGYFAQFLKDEDGNMFLLSRSRNVSGEFPNKIEWVPHLQPFFDDIPNGTCLLGELYLPSKPGSSNITTILGCLKEKAIKRQEDEKLQFYIFDILAYENKLYINEPAKSRMVALEHLNQFFGHHYNYINFAIYYEGEELWNQLQEILAEFIAGIIPEFFAQCRLLAGVRLEHIQEVHVIDLQQKRIAVKQTILEMTVAFFPKMFLYIFLVIAFTIIKFIAIFYLCN